MENKYKEKFFIKLFSDKNRALQLYNALNGSDYEDGICVKRSYNALKLYRYDDVAFIISCDLYSAPDPLLPYLMIGELASLFSSYAYETCQNIYGNERVSLPAPRLIHLHDGPDGEVKMSGESIEVCVHLVDVRNVDCEPVREYAWLVTKIKEGIGNGLEVRTAIKQAIQKIPDDYVIKPYINMIGEEAEAIAVC